MSRRSEASQHGAASLRFQTQAVLPWSLGYLLKGWVRGETSFLSNAISDGLQTVYPVVGSTETHAICCAVVCFAGSSFRLGTACGGNGDAGEDAGEDAGACNLSREGTEDRWIEDRHAIPL